MSPGSELPQLWLHALPPLKVLEARGHLGSKEELKLLALPEL